MRAWVCVCVSGAHDSICLLSCQMIRAFVVKALRSCSVFLTGLRLSTGDYKIIAKRL